jgi:hypothetical protein
VQVLHQDVKSRQASPVTMVLVRRLDAAEAHKRLPPRLLRRVAAPLVFLDRRFQARSHFPVELLVERLLGEESPQPIERFLESIIHRWPSSFCAASTLSHHAGRAMLVHAIMGEFFTASFRNRIELRLAVVVRGLQSAEILRLCRSVTRRIVEGSLSQDSSSGTATSS